MTAASVLQRIVVNDQIPWRLRYVLSVGLLKRMMPADAPLVDGYVGKYRMQFRFKDHIQQEVYLGFYEPIETRLLRRLLKPGDVFFDVGANVGYYSLTVSQLVGSAGAVHSFEPIAENAGVLRQTITQNQIANIRLNEVAVGKAAGELTLYTDDIESLGNSGWASTTPADYKSKTVHVPMTSLDDYIAEQQIDRVDMVKIDVEGAELDVLQGMQQLLARADGPDLLCEVRPDHSRTLTGYLGAHGYTLSPLPFTDTLKAGEELPHLINLFCTKRPAN